VPAFADACVIYLLEDGKASRLYSASLNERMARVFDELNQRFPPDLSPDSQLSRVLATGRPTMVAEFQQEWSSQSNVDPEHRKLIDSLDVKSLVLVPLMSQGRLAGILALMRCGYSRPFDEREFSVAVEFGARAAHAMDNAQLYEDLRAANRAKDEFLGIISHELRTPVTTIYGGARLLHSRWSSLDEESVSGLVQDIESESERLYRLIENLLVLGRLELGEEVVKQPVAVKPALQKLLATFGRRRASREVKVSLQDDVDIVDAEPTYLDQILYNLLTNADKYSPADRPIEIEVTQAASGSVFRVMDRGPGIPEEDMGRVFESFYRSKANPRGTPGKGVGLAVCKRLVEAMGGQIWVASREGGGFEVGFVLHRSDEARAEQTSETE
jgi:K+-sensing histidine kinase KdpD